jgi:hypothetical protein
MPIGQLISSSVLILVEGICTDGNFEWNSDTFIRPNQEHLQKNAKTSSLAGIEPHVALPLL